MMNEVVKEVRDLLRTSMGSSVVKTFYAGRVGIPAKAFLPAVIVEERATEIVRQSTAKDLYKFSLVISVICDVTQNYAVAGITDDVVDTYQTLRNLIEEADTDGAPKTTTVLGTLMKQANIRGTNFAYNMNGRVNYRPTFPGQDNFFYIAAEVELDVLADFVTRKA